MNYLSKYIKLIRNAQSREIAPEFFEEHHIFPESIYGKNSYTVKLSSREHYIAHLLLYKALKTRYGATHHRTAKMAYALWRINTAKIRIEGKKSTESILYRMAKNAFIENHPLLGKKHSEQTKLKIGMANSGRLIGDKNPMYGKFGSNHPRFGQQHTEESKEKIGRSRRGEKHPMFGKTGDKNPFFGKVHTEESLKVMSKKASRNNRGRKWWTNGTKDTFARECPEGFYAGRSATRKNT